MLEKITGLISLVFSPLTVFHPCVAIFILALITSLFVSIISRALVKKEEVNNLKKRMEELRRKMEAAEKSKNKEESEKVMKEMLEVNKEYFKNTIKSLFVGILVAIVVFFWVSKTYPGTVVEVPVGKLQVSGIYWYIFVSFIISLVINKIIE
jgi:uncharacterized membrane protein (DUF106 family)